MFKKILLIMQFMVTFGSYNLESMFFAFGMAAVDEDEDNCCKACIAPIFTLLIGLLESENYQRTDSFNQTIDPLSDQNKFAQSMYSISVHSQLNKLQIRYDNKKID